MKKYNPQEDITIGDDPRWQEVQKMILEMVGFNFTYTLELSDKNDRLESVKLGLKYLGEELYAYFRDNGHAYCAMNISYRFNANFILDWEGRILATTNGARFLLRHYKTGDSGPLTDLLTEPSKGVWKERLDMIRGTDRYDDKPMILEFLDWDKTPLPHLCNFSTFNENGDGPNRVLFNIIPLQRIENLRNSGNLMVLENMAVYGKKNKPGSKMKYTEIRWCKEARKHILGNITKELPSTKNLALMVGTNQKNLRIYFKRLYGTSIRQFIILKRLNLALPLVQFSDMEFQTIAENTGFRSYPHFSTAFTAKFGHSPREYRNRVKSGEIIP